MGRRHRLARAEPCDQEGQTLNNLGAVYARQRRWDDAIACYERSLTICWELGDRYGEGLTVANLGVAAEARGDLSSAHQHWRKALAIFETLGAQEAVQVRSLIDG